MHRFFVSVMLVAVPAVTACTYRSGNDDSLSPLVHRGPDNTGTFSISSGWGSQIAVFEPIYESDGWRLRFLGSVDSLGTLRYSAPTRMVSLGSVLPFGVSRGTQMQYYHLGDLCPWDACSQFVGDLYPPPAPVWARQTPALVSEFTYVLVSASTEHLSDQQWEALADSVHVRALASAPGALGRLAFRGNLTARWEVALRELPLKPTTGPDSSSSQPGYEFKKMAASP